MSTPRLSRPRVRRREAPTSPACSRADQLAPTAVQRFPCRASEWHAAACRRGNCVPRSPAHHTTPRPRAGPLRRLAQCLAPSLDSLTSSTAAALSLSLPDSRATGTAVATATTPGLLPRKSETRASGSQASGTAPPARTAQHSSSTAGARHPATRRPAHAGTLTLL